MMCSGDVTHSCAVKDRHRKVFSHDSQQRPPGWYKLVLHHHRRNHQAIQKTLGKGKIMQRASCPSSNASHKPILLLFAKALAPRGFCRGKNLIDIDRTVFKGVSWGAGVLILVAAAWALAHNAGYAPLLKVIWVNFALPSRACVQPRLT
jgi:hypothetical protein